MIDAYNVGEFVSKRIWELENTDNSAAKKAKLRRGVGKDIQESMDSWSIVLADMPEELKGIERNGTFKPSFGEIAIHSALTLYALHSQGQTISVNIEKISFGCACSHLISGKRNADAIVRRFDAIITSSGLNELLYHMRGMITLMRSASSDVIVVGLDYPQLAKDLYYLQLPGNIQNVLIKWGQDFYSNLKNDLNKNKEE